MQILLSAFDGQSAQVAAIGRACFAALLCSTSLMSHLHLPDVRSDAHRLCLMLLRVCCSLALAHRAASCCQRRAKNTAKEDVEDYAQSVSSSRSVRGFEMLCSCALGCCYA